MIVKGKGLGAHATQMEVPMDILMENEANSDFL